MAEQELDRNHAATPYKLEKARERGQVAKSADVVAAVVFSSAIVFLTWQGSKTWQDQFRLDHALLTQAARIDASPAALWSLVERMLRETLALSIPFFATLMLAAIVGNLLQTGAVFSITPLKPDWSRVNPVTGFKRLLSLRTLFQGVRALLKLALLGTVVWFSLKNLTPRFFALAAASAPSAVRHLLDAIGSLGLRMALTLAVIAVLDLAYTRREFAKQMRMSRRELKEEVRHREGDPRIRARLRELRREMLKRTLALRKTRGADVVITNPTHVSVALRYAHGEMESPQVIAKGTGSLASAMRGIAARHGIPVVQNPTLARALFREVAVDGAVPPNLYAPVARIVVWVLAMRRRRNAPRRGSDEQRAVPSEVAAWAS
jgi:flagellar biosynthetic protein FlhB